MAVSHRALALARALAGLALLASACVGGIGGHAEEEPGAGGAPRGSGASTDRAVPAPGPGSAGGAPGATAVGGAPGGISTGPAAAPAAAFVGPAPLRRLTAFEYANTLRTWLYGAEAGSLPDAVRQLPPDDLSQGYDRVAEALAVTDAHVERWHQIAEEAARLAGARLARLVPCDVAAAGEQGCARLAVERLGRRAYRRPLAAAEIAALASLYEAGRAAEGHAAGLEWALTAILSSPHFLYRVERAGGAGRRLAPHEQAARLSYFLWADAPDDALAASAEAGRLDTEEGLAAEARRLLADRRARRAVAHFHAQWLDFEALDGVTKSGRLFPEFAALRADLGRELATFVEETFFREGRLAALLAAPHTYVNARLAGFYGLAPPAPASSSAFTKVAVDAERRAGLVTQGALLAALAHPEQTSPVLRGRFVRTQLLCAPVPPPPPEVNDTPAPPRPGTTTRQRAEQHLEPACAACHQHLDPIGFLLEGFDPVGRQRATDGGLPVDTRGAIRGTRASDAVLAGAVPLARHLAASDDVRRCLADNWLRYALGRRLAPEDEPTIASLARGLAAAGDDLRELPILIARSAPFRFPPEAAR